MTIAAVCLSPAKSAPMRIFEEIGVVTGSGIMGNQHASITPDEETLG